MFLDTVLGEVTCYDCKHIQAFGSLSTDDAARMCKQSPFKGTINYWIHNDICKASTTQCAVSILACTTKALSFPSVLWYDSIIIVPRITPLINIFHMNNYIIKTCTVEVVVVNRILPPEVLL